MAFAEDTDNNGIAGDETYVPEVFNGNPDRTESVAFPTSLDTWSVSSYPYWWHVGDTVYGVHTVTYSSVCHADVALKIDVNVLNSGGGHVDLDFKINNTTVGSLGSPKPMGRDSCTDPSPSRRSPPSSFATTKQTWWLRAPAALL
jgi:hypothetical protein